MNPKKNDIVYYCTYDYKVIKGKVSKDLEGDNTHAYVSLESEKHPIIL